MARQGKDVKKKRKVLEIAIKRKKGFKDIQKSYNELLKTIRERRKKKLAPNKKGE